MKVSDEILKQVSDAYRKIRNTIRFLLGNINDFNPETDLVEFADLEEIDKWAMVKYAELVKRVTSAYDRYEFHTVYHSLFNFCGTVISSLYMDVLKDRLYCSTPDDRGRRAAQTTIYRILDGLLKLMAPILCFTSDEAWAYFKGLQQNGPVAETISFADFPSVSDIEEDAELIERWDKLLTLRSVITKVLENARREKIIGLSLDAEVVLKVNSKWDAFVREQKDQLQELCIISSLVIAGEQDNGEFTSDENVEGVEVAVKNAPGEKCERCWMISTTVGDDEAYPTACERCAKVIRQLLS